MRRPVLATIALCAAATAAIAAADDRAVCGSVPPKSDAVAACSRIIAAPRTSAHDRIMALIFRAGAERSRGNGAAAIADYSRALELDPNNADALYRRGVTRTGSGDAAGGEADIAAAKAIDPAVAGKP